VLRSGEGRGQAQERASVLRHRQMLRKVPSQRTVRAARNVLRAALNQAIAEDLLIRNPAALARVRTPRKQRREPWSVDEARRFLENAGRPATPSTPPTSWSSFSAFVVVRYWA
jgi:integrase